MDIYSPIVTCPYNQSHQILKCRMPYHLVKCAKNYPNVHLEICPFDATHRMPKAEYLHHLSVCPDRKLVEKHKYPLENVHGALRSCPIENFEMDRFTEKWDDGNNDERPGNVASTIGDFTVNDEESNYQNDVEYSDEDFGQQGAAGLCEEDLPDVKLLQGLGKGFGRGASLLSMISCTRNSASALRKPGALKNSSSALPSHIKEVSGNETQNLEILNHSNVVDYVACDEDSYKFIMSWGRGKFS